MMPRRQKGKIIIISGPSGSGKTTLYQKLLDSPRLKSKLAKSISVTTRPCRPGEKHGHDYFFVSRRMFAYKKRANHFLESQRVFDNHYGTPQKNVKEILSGGKSVLLCIDVKGARVVRKKFPQAASFFIKAPSLNVLKKRLTCRGSENKKTVKLRLDTAKEELKDAQYYDKVFVNRDLAKCFRDLEAAVAREIGQ